MNKEQKKVVVDTSRPLQVLNSKQYSLNVRDIAKGALVAFITALLTALYTALDGGTLALTWVFLKPILINAALAGVSYIAKNFLQSNATAVVRVNPNTDVIKVDASTKTAA